MLVYRKVTEEDLFGKSTNIQNFKYLPKLKIRKNQREYGEKKFIKP